MEIHDTCSKKFTRQCCVNIQFESTFLLSMLRQVFLKYRVIYKGSTKIAQDLSVSAKAALQETW